MLPIRIGAAAAVLAVGAVLSPLPAQAAPPATVSAGCPYPYVCFAFGEDIGGMYKDMTSGWQTLGPRSRGAEWVINTRHDDGALLHYTNGDVRCARANHTFPAHQYGTVDKVRIVNDAFC